MLFTSILPPVISYLICIEKIPYLKYFLITPLWSVHKTFLFFVFWKAIRNSDKYVLNIRYALPGQNKMSELQNEKRLELG